MSLGNLDQRLDVAEEGLKELKFSIARLQQQLNNQLSVLFEKMTSENERMCSTLGEVIRTSIAEKRHGINGRSPPPGSPPTPPPGSEGREGGLMDVLQTDGEDDWKFWLLPSESSPPPSPPSLGFVNNSGAASLSNGGSNRIVRKLEMPLFNGNNSDGWILEAERLFSCYRLSEDKKLEVAVMSLEGDVSLWYDWEHTRRPIRDWEELKGLIHRQYRSTMVEACYDQSTSMFHAREKTQHMTAPLKKVTEEGFLGQHKNGLKNKWTDIGDGGSRILEPVKELGITNEEKLSPHALKSTKLNLATQARSTGVSPFLTLAPPSPIGTQASVTITDSIPSNHEDDVFKGRGKSIDQNKNLTEIKATTIHKLISESGGILLPEFALLDSGAFKLTKEGFMLLQFAPADGVHRYDWSRRQVLSFAVAKIRCSSRLWVRDSYVFFHEPFKDWISFRFEVEISNELSESVKAIIQLILEVCSSPNLDSNTSHQAIQIILGVGKYKSSSLDKNKLVIPVFQVMCPLLTEATNREDDKFSDSLVFKDDKGYSKELAHDAERLCKFKRNQPGLYSAGGSDAEIFYNLNMHWNKCLWAESWMYAAMVVEVDRRVGATTTVTGRGGAFVSFCHDGSSKVKFLGEAGNMSGFYIQPVKDVPSLLKEIGKVHKFVHEKMQWVLVTDGTRNSITHSPHEVSDSLLTSSFSSPYVNCKSIVPSNYNLVGYMIRFRFCNLTMRANGQMKCNRVPDLLDQRINKGEFIEINWEGQMGIIPVEKVDHAKEKTLPIVDEMQTSRKDANASTEKLKEHWKPMPVSEATGEESMYHIFPSFHLEDKVNLWGWGIVTHQVYSENLSKGILGNSASKGASD